MSSFGRVVLLVGAMLFVAQLGAAAEAPGQPAVHALLDVPYVSQTPELCGGAAVAMVLRYWGERSVFAQDFAPLVDAAERGIHANTLTSAVRDRGWQALVVPTVDDGAHERVQSEIDQGRPLIALIEVGPRTYHYVVIVGATDREVVLHDPARAPFRVLPWAEFERAWAATGRWLLLVLPSSGFRAGLAPTRDTPTTVDAHILDNPTPCSGLVERGVQLALAGDAAAAEQGLLAATGLCPNDPAAWRELAGVRFSQSRWPEARDLALSATRLAPDDAYAWQLVATSRSLMGDAMGALDAWNRAGEPRVDTIAVHGAERTRQPIVVHATGLQPREMLTPAAFGLALRRLRDLPVAVNARMRYESLDGGLAKVDVFIAEGARVPSDWIAFGALGARALLLDELVVDVAGPLGAGERERFAWRWSPERPRVALGLALPSPDWLPGIISLEGSWERQTYDAKRSPSDVTLIREERRRVAVQVADWSTSWLRWQTGAALDRWHGPAGRVDDADHVAIEGALDVRLADDRVALAADGSWWVPFAGGNRFGTSRLLAAWRSARTAASGETTRPSWSAVSALEVATTAAPLALWHGAGTGQGRSGLLRAHPLLDSGILTGSAFGRHVAHSSLEYERPTGHLQAAGLAVAGFADAARAWHPLNGSEPSRLYLDVGAGLRVHAPGLGSVIRLDVARGLRGGGTTLSAGWGGVWPR